MTFSLTVRDLGLILDRELSQHVNLVFRSCYYQLRQLRVVSCSLSLMTLSWSSSMPSSPVELTIVARYLLASPLGSWDDLIESCARLIGRLPKFASVSAYMCDVLHWLPVSQRISYRIAAMVFRCVLGFAPSYLRDLCRPVSDVAARRVLRFAASGELLVPRARLATRQRRAFSVVGPSIWNDLPPELRSLLLINPTGFYKSLKSFFFSRGWAASAHE